MKIVPMSVAYCYHSGDDLSVVNAARVSFHKESKYESLTAVRPLLSEKDQKLIKYLATHNHWTPFAHNSITLRIKAPLFVARQAGKHQVGLVWNEVSRRYVDEEPEFYMPDVWRGKADNAKQGSDGIVELQYDPIKEVCGPALDHYNNLLKAGVAPEQARMVLPQNMMTEWIWTGSLAAFARVCRLRLDPHSQQEIQELAGMIKDVIEPLFPVSWPHLTA